MMPEKRKLCQIMEHITDLDFITPPALAFKQALRRWYYGEQDEQQARYLLTQFDALFTGDVLSDVAGGALAGYVEQSPLELEDSQRLALLRISPKAIVGRSIRAYGLTGDGVRYDFPGWLKDATQRLSDVLDAAQAQLKKERLWRETNKVSLFTALLCLAGMGALVLGLWRLADLALQAVRLRSLPRLISSLPLCAFGEGAAWLCVVLFAATVVDLAVLLRPMALSLAGGLWWAFCQKWRLLRRTRQVEQLRQALSSEGLKDYFLKLQTAAVQLQGQSWDTPRDQDPSAGLVGRAGLVKVFQTCPIRTLPRWRGGKRLARAVGKHHVKARLWLLVLCAGSVLFWQALWVN